MADLQTLRQELHRDLKSYPRRELDVVRERWKMTGLFGGHRDYLGHSLWSTLMALSFGGFGVWWFLDKRNLSQITETWNQDQAERERTQREPKDTEGLELIEPAMLQTPPPWRDDPPSKAEKFITAFMEWPLRMSLAMTRFMSAPLRRIPILGGLYGAIFDFQERLTEKIYSVSEQIQLALITGFVSFMATKIGAIEVALLMIGVNAVLTFTSLFARMSHTAIGRAALEWDYLLCSYYHQNRPDPFFVAYFKSAIMFYPRLFGFGPEGERNLFNRLTGQAAMLSFLFIPVDLIMALFGGDSVIKGGFFVELLVGLFASVSLLAMYAPAVCGSLTRYKVLGQRTRLYIAGGLGTVSSTIGLVAGYVT